MRAMARTLSPYQEKEATESASVGKYTATHRFIVCIRARRAIGTRSRDRFGIPSDRAVDRLPRARIFDICTGVSERTGTHPVGFGVFARVALDACGRN